MCKKESHFRVQYFLLSENIKKNVLVSVKKKNQLLYSNTKAYTFKLY